MTSSMRISGILVGALMVLMMTGTLEQVSATSPWGIGAQTSALPTGTVDVISYVSIPNLPSTTARNLGTLFWIGAYSTSGGTTYLSQPELRADSSTLWRVTLETVHGSIRDDWYPSNMYCSPGGSVTMYDAILSDGRNFQDVENRSNCNVLGVSKYFSKVNYGTKFTQAFTSLESYDSTTSDFHSMNGNLQFTSFRTSTNYATYGARTLTHDYSTSPLPPSCITSVGGTGTNTITVSC